MALRQPRYSKEEFARRGDAVDEAQVRCQIEPGNHGKIVAIDLETGDFEVDPSEIAACDRLGLAIPLLKLDGSYWFSPCSKIWWTHSQTCMMTGVVNAALESAIPLLICRSVGKILTNNAIVDTGFNGWLSLPPDVISQLKLEWKRRGRAVLGDGSECIVDVFEAVVVIVPSEGTHLAPTPPPQPRTPHPLGSAR